MSPSVVSALFLTLGVQTPTFGFVTRLVNVIRRGSFFAVLRSKCMTKNLFAIGLNCTYT